MSAFLLSILSEVTQNPSMCGHATITIMEGKTPTTRVSHSDPGYFGGGRRSNRLEEIAGFRHWVRHVTQNFIKCHHMLSPEMIKLDFRLFSPSNSKCF